MNTFRNRSVIFIVIILLCAAFAPRPASAQDWFKTGTGLGVDKARLAVPEFAARSAQAAPLEKVFHDVLWKDLEFCGILDMVSPSFYPTQVPSQPGELRATDWSQAPANAYMVAFGNLAVDATGLAASGYLFDVHNPTAPPVLQKIYRGAVTERMPASWRTNLPTISSRG